jgi:hypothetical protein
MNARRPAKSRLQELSIGKPGEEFDASLIGDIVRIGKLS